MTWDYIDNEEILTRHGGYDPARHYDFAELLDINVRAVKSVGVDMTRGVYDPTLHHSRRVLLHGQGFGLVYGRRSAPRDFRRQVPDDVAGSRSLCNGWFPLCYRFGLRARPVPRWLLSWQFRPSGSLLQRS